jgi:hypothetical protein
MKKLFLIAIIFSTIFFSCSKKNKLQTDTLTIYVTPSPVVVEPGKSIELQATGKSAKSDNVDINPQWILDPESLGSISPTRGKKTTFTASANTGSGKIKVIEENVYTEVNVTITTQTQSGGGSGGNLILKVYYDSGNDKSVISGDDIWTWSDNNLGTFDANYQDSTAPEGYKSFKTTTSTGSWAGWGVVYNTPQDLSQYQGGYLKFCVKSPAPIKIEIQDGNGNNYTRYTSQYGYTNNNTWSELTISLSDFGSVPLNNIKLPFMATIETSGEFYIDYVRWEK